MGLPRPQLGEKGAGLLTLCRDHRGKEGLTMQIFTNVGGHDLADILEESLKETEPWPPPSGRC